MFELTALNDQVFTLENLDELQVELQSDETEDDDETEVFSFLKIDWEALGVGKPEWLEWLDLFSEYDDVSDDTDDADDGDSESDNEDMDYVLGTDLSEVINVFTGDDMILASLGDDFINGGEDIDQFFIGGFSDDFEITIDENMNIEITSDQFGSDILENIERIHLFDQSYANDLDGNAGVAARAIITALGADQVDSFMGVTLGLTDEGASFSELFDLVVDLELIEEMIGDDSDEGFVGHIFANVVGRQGTEEEIEVYTDLLDEGLFTRTGLMEFAADTELTANIMNELAIEIVGIPFTPVEVA